VGRQIQRAGVDVEAAGDRNHGRDHERDDADADRQTPTRLAKAACLAATAY